MSADYYRQKADEMAALAHRERRPHLREDLQALALCYWRLAAQADLNSRLDLAVELHSRKSVQL